MIKTLTKDNIYREKLASDYLKKSEVMWIHIVKLNRKGVLFFRCTI
jgi:hypothetical protein